MIQPDTKSDENGERGESYEKEVHKGEEREGEEDEGLAGWGS